jgi:hypothetical protein
VVRIVFALKIVEKNISDSAIDWRNSKAKH